MASRIPIVSIHRRIADLPLAWRGLVTAMVVSLGFGYGAALVNLVGQSELADGKPGLTSDDLILKYHGGYVEAPQDQPPPSRMLEMCMGDMRDEFESDEHFDIVRAWLGGDADKQSFASGTPLSPKGVFESDCLSCHAADSGMDLATTSPFGHNDKAADFDLIAKFTEPLPQEGAMVWKAPKNWRKLALSTHTHVLAVPMFVVLMGAFFLWSGWLRDGGRWSRRLRAAIAVAPVLFFLGDVSCWWLARLEHMGVAFALAIGGFGALFAVTFSLQWFVVMAHLWPPRQLFARAKAHARAAATHADTGWPIHPAVAFAPASSGQQPVASERRDLDALRKVDRDAERLVAMLEASPAAAARAESQGSGSEPTFNVFEVLYEIAERSTGLCGEKPVEIQMDRSGPPILIAADRRRFHDIITELVGNAVKRTDRGLVVLSAMESVDACIGHGVRVSVKDPAATQETCDLPGVLTTVSKGSRISLAMEGGRLEANGTGDSGNEFTAVFPLEHAETGAQRTNEPEVEHADA